MTIKCISLDIKTFSYCIVCGLNICLFANNVILFFFLSSVFALFCDCLYHLLSATICHLIYNSLCVTGSQGSFCRYWISSVIIDLPVSQRSFISTPLLSLVLWNESPFNRSPVYKQLYFSGSWNS